MAAAASLRHEPGQQHFVLWDTVSMAWSEIGLGAEAYPRIAAKLRTQYASWDEIRGVVHGDVIASFALESCFLPLALVPVLGLFMVAILPDWGYEEAYLRRRMQRWYARPRWVHFLNPLRLAGYPVAQLMAFMLCRRLKAAYRAAGA